jgi:hypothetical protein
MNHEICTYSTHYNHFCENLRPNMQMLILLLHLNMSGKFTLIGLHMFSSCILNNLHFLLVMMFTDFE